jgi:hypothetical protein
MCKSNRASAAWGFSCRSGSAVAPEVLKWAKDILWAPQKGNTRREYADSYEKLKAAELKSKCAQSWASSIELTSIPIGKKSCLARRRL